LWLPAVTGGGWIAAASELHFDPTDPYRLSLPGVG
jgi:proline racemase